MAPEDFRGHCFLGIFCPHGVNLADKQAIISSSQFFNSYHIWYFPLDKGLAGRGL